MIVLQFELNKKLEGNVLMITSGNNVSKNECPNGLIELPI